MEQSSILCCELIQIGLFILTESTAGSFKIWHQGILYFAPLFRYYVC